MLFGTLAVEVKKIGNYNLIPTADGIFFRSNNNFLIVHVEKKSLKLEILLNKQISNIKKLDKVEMENENRYRHYLSISQTKEIGPPLIDALKEAYNIA
ncbi:hypothetical protein EMN47_19630 [Prolixibacteraceae bacterium JC049]|nr:hypothetical protein [Prolixibacteraceae bacterium JC049]